jgi:16S rRNA (uracil1498-N3)-methyltransferase
MRRFFVSSEGIFGDEIRVTNQNDIHHIKTVLRLREGTAVSISDGSKKYEAEILSFERDAIVLRITGAEKIAPENGPKITLFQSMPKQKKLEFITQKSIEIGVDEVRPFISERSILAKAFDREAKLKRLKKIAAESAMQSRSEAVPSVHDFLSKGAIYDFLKSVKYDLSLLLYEDEKEISIKSVLRGEPCGREEKESPPKKVALIVGPEGGFSEDEAGLFAAAGVTAVSLGKNILRTETAGLAALSILNYEFYL